MILNGTPEEWVALWGAIEDEMQDSTEKGLTVIFSVHEVETVCAVKMMQVCSHSLHVAAEKLKTASSRRAVPDTQQLFFVVAAHHNITHRKVLTFHQTCGYSKQSAVETASFGACLNSTDFVL
jgi:hypothetical protein